METVSAGEEAVSTGKTDTEEFDTIAKRAEENRLAVPAAHPANADPRNAGVPQADAHPRETMMSW